MKGTHRLPILHDPFGQLGTDPRQCIKISVRRSIQIEESLVVSFRCCSSGPLIRQRSSWSRAHRGYAPTVRGNLNLRSLKRFGYNVALTVEGGRQSPSDPNHDP